MATRVVVSSWLATKWRSLSNMAVKHLKQSETFEYYTYSELAKEVCQLLGRNIRDYDQSLSHFGRWCDATGRGETDPEGKHRNSSQIWYAEYHNDPNGQRVQPVYRDFWHWWLTQTEVENGEYDRWINFTEIRDEFLEDEDFDQEENGWIVEVLNAFIAVLGEDGNQDITLYYYW